VSPSTLASAYRATTHFTPRDGVAEPCMATITASLSRVSDFPSRRVSLGLTAGVQSPAVISFAYASTSHA
jgi:hypothetical protein